VADVCVVGLGGSGLAAIHELQRHGARVVGLDARQVAGGAAGRNGGFLLAGPADFHHDAIRIAGHARAVALYRRTLDEIDRMMGETPEAIRRTGSLRIAESAEELDDCRAQLAAMTADGLAAEWYAGPEGEGLLIPTDAVFHPVARCRTMAGRAAMAGAALYEATAADTIAGDAVATAEGMVRCGAVIVAVDGRLERTLPELVGRVRTARLQMLATAPTAEVRFPRAVYSRYGYEYWQQLPDGSVVLGGFRDRGGEGEWTDRAEPAEPVQGMLEAHLRTRLGVTAAITHRWAGVVGYTPTGLPISEEVRPGVWAVGAYSGTGNVVGAICGRGAARAVLGLPDPDAELFR
jgi:glycine/D-amino acid oxidase-like deaminating enzyme